MGNKTRNGSACAGKSKAIQKHRCRAFFTIRGRKRRLLIQETPYCRTTFSLVMVIDMCGYSPQKTGVLWCAIACFRGTGACLCAVANRLDSSTPVKSSLLALCFLFLLTHGLHGGEEQHVADGSAVGHQHDHAVQAEAQAARGGHRRACGLSRAISLMADLITF